MEKNDVEFLKKPMQDFIRKLLKQNDIFSSCELPKANLGAFY